MRTYAVVLPRWGGNDMLNKRKVNRDKRRSVIRSVAWRKIARKHAVIMASNLYRLTCGCNACRSLRNFNREGGA